MKSTTPESTQTQFLTTTLPELCSPKESIYQLSKTIDWV